MRYLALLFALTLHAQQPDFYKQLKNGPVFSNSFEFEIGAASVTGSLSTAGAKTITLRQSPPGVSGTNPQHYLYISGGTGTAEPVLITGGTCVGGVLTSCTLSFTTANTHTGSWTIRSATAGMKEAYQSYRQTVPGGTEFRMELPAGDHNTFACAYMNDISVFITGKGQWTSRIKASGLALSTCALSMRNTVAGPYYCSISGISVWPTGGAFTSTVPAFYVEDYVLGGVSDALFLSPGIAIDWSNANGGNPTDFKDIRIFGGKQHGLRLRSTGAGQNAGTISGFYFDGAGAIAIELGGTIAGITMSDLWIQQTGYCVVIDGTTRNTNEIVISNSICDGPTIAGFSIIGQSAIAGTNGIRIGNTLIQHDASSYGVLIQSNWKTFLNDITFNNASSNPSVIINTASNVGINDCEFHGNSGITAPYLARLIGATSNISFKGNRFTAEGAVAAGISMSAESHINTKLMGNESTTNITTGVSNGSTVGPVIFKSNLFTSTFASAATIAAPAPDYGNLIVLTGTTANSRMTGAFPGEVYYVTTTSAVQFNTGGANPGNYAGAVLTTPGQTVAMRQDLATGIITITP